MQPHSWPDKGQRSTVRLAARAAGGSLCILQPAGMQGQMIFWEGWFLSQYDAEFGECQRILFGMESSDVGSCGWECRADGQVSRCLGAGSCACYTALLTTVQTTLIKQMVAVTLVQRCRWAVPGALVIGRDQPMPDRGRSHILVRSPARIPRQVRPGDGIKRPTSQMELR